MPDRASLSSQQGSGATDRSLLERVRGRVRTVTHAIQRRYKNSLAPVGDRAPLSRELRALHFVYHTMGRTHRLYREKTGEQVSPQLKAAARAFTREPNIFSLVPVAGILDDLHLLKW